MKRKHGHLNLNIEKLKTFITIIFYFSFGMSIASVPLQKRSNLCPCKVFIRNSCSRKRLCSFDKNANIDCLTEYLCYLYNAFIRNVSRYLEKSLVVEKSPLCIYRNIGI